jgi:tRNA threonylcarbamoyladenosine biosynthesis protein TsaB
VRTACGVAQGLAFGANLPVVPVVTLDAMALACRQQHGAADVLAVLDARMGEVYWAQYRFEGGGDAVATAIPSPVVVLAPALSAPEGVTPQGAPIACGNGLSAYAEAFAERFAAGGFATVMPHAEQIAQLASIAFAAGKTVTAAEAQPLYLRNKIAYTQAERRDMATAAASTAAAAAANAASADNADNADNAANAATATAAAAKAAEGAA